MKRAAGWWLVFGACVLVVAAALVWTSAVVIRLERSELSARAETEYQESLRLAMWRMDSWLSLFLARESAGPPAHDVDSDLVLLSFDVDRRGVTTSPKLPRPLPSLRLESLRAAVGLADVAVDKKAESAVRPDGDRPWFDLQLVKSNNEFDARVACAVPRPAGAAGAGRQVVAWLDAASPAQPGLAFVRRLETDGEERFSGFVLDWPRLRERLLGEIRDLFPEADLVRVPTTAAMADTRGLGLVNVPVVLCTPHPGAVVGVGITAVRAALGLAWLAVIGALVAVGATLRTSIDLGERRRRFVSAVTHELRTPLTTFQMYTEMLADGVVRTEEQRRVYLQTLKDESRRLSVMVANVLAHAQLEERRGPCHVESHSLPSLIERVRPPLDRAAASSGMTLEVQIDASSAEPLRVDPDAIGRILINLVDNAAKYARGGEQATISLLASAHDGSLSLTVRDRGPGRPGAQAKAIFVPFERGGRNSSDPVPGVGLGLALSRRLARDMGGDLVLDAENRQGAAFRLILPARLG